MSQLNPVHALTILSADQASQRFADLTSEAFLRDIQTELSANMRTYRLPQSKNERRVLADNLAEAVTSYQRQGILCITHWWDETAGFEEYRRSLGDSRPLRKAPIHLFSDEHRAEIRRLLRFVLELDWDCFLFDKGFNYMAEISHDGYVNLTGSHSDFPEGTIARFADRSLKPLPKRVVNLDY